MKENKNRNSSSLIISILRKMEKPHENTKQMLKKFVDTEVENCNLFFLKRTRAIPANIINPDA